MWYIYIDLIITTILTMIFSYKNMETTIDKDMKKKDLQKLVGVSSASITKLGKNENVNTDVLVKICRALDCDVSDIINSFQMMKISRL